MVKRGLDIVLSFFGLLLLLPLFLLVAFAIKLSSHGSVFFLQERIGQHFKAFMLYKFRSMVNDATGKGPAITALRDPRITPVGRLLRKTKIDELPQLINVLKGDMSLVGPRPEVPRYVNLFRQDYEVILQVRPGITDRASVLFRNEEAVLERYQDPEQGYIREVLPQKIALYKEYIQKNSLWDDIQILISTLLAVFKN